MPAAGGAPQASRSTVMPTPGATPPAALLRQGQWQAAAGQAGHGGTRASPKHNRTGWSPWQTGRLRSRSGVFCAHEFLSPCSARRLVALGVGRGNLHGDCRVRRVAAGARVVGVGRGPNGQCRRRLVVAAPSTATWHQDPQQLVRKKLQLLPKWLPACHHQSDLFVPLCDC